MFYFFSTRSEESGRAKKGEVLIFNAWCIYKRHIYKGTERKEGEERKRKENTLSGVSSPCMSTLHIKIKLIFKGKKKSATDRIEGTNNKEERFSYLFMSVFDFRMQKGWEKIIFTRQSKGKKKRRRKEKNDKQVLLIHFENIYLILSINKFILKHNNIYDTMTPSSMGIFLQFVIGNIHSRWIIGWNIVSLFSTSMISSRHFTSSRSSSSRFVSAIKRLTVASNDFWKLKKKREEKWNDEKNDT